MASEPTYRGLERHIQTIFGAVGTFFAAATFALMGWALLTLHNISLNVATQEVLLAEMLVELSEVKADVKMAGADRYHGKQAQIDFALRDGVMNGILGQLERLENRFEVRMNKIEKSN